MKNIIIPIFLFLGFISNAQKVIYIQPLGEVDSEYIKTVKSSLESFFGATCILKTKVPLTNDLLSPSKTRYEGGKILNKFNSKDNVIVLTEKDITTQKGNNPEWGILGLGYRPGTVCVVSTFRMKRTTDKELIHQRLRKISIHEVGHNLGLDHCTNDITCLMNDARGTISQVDREKIQFCGKCKKQIGMY